MPVKNPDLLPLFEEVKASYVGLYYMPVYTHEAAAGLFGPDLMATLKGKSCFYIKHLTPELRAQITDAFEHGIRMYSERDWV